MHDGLHGDCCFTPSWPTLPTSEGLLHVPADDAWAAHTARPRTAASAVAAARLSDAQAKFSWIAMIITVVGAFRVGAAVLAFGSTDTTGTPAATTTMTETAPNDEPNEEPTEEPTAAGFTPRKSDFEIEIKILEKKCFGSAGCSVTHRIKPKYVGTQELN
jgi:hypothetical protein